jgi:hypothetical protein
MCLMKNVMLAAVFLAAATDRAGAQVPDSDIWVADVLGEGTSLHLGTPVNVTHRPGYDNQPCFLYRNGPVTDVPTTPVGFLFTSADSLGATDIYQWDPKTDVIARVTHTPESEYSPTPFGGVWKGPAGFYTVRVEADSTQRLWRFDIDGSNPRLVMADVDSVGYFAWIDEGHVAAFVLGNEKKKQPHTLRVIDVATQTETIVARDIGRAIHLIPGTGDISFTVHEDDETYRFFVLKQGGRTGTPLIDAMGTGQDAAWLGATMLMSAGTRLYAATPGSGWGSSGQRGVWRPVVDFADIGITGITRIAVSPGHQQIAFVAVTGTP